MYITLKKIKDIVSMYFHGSNKPENQREARSIDMMSKSSYEELMKWIHSINIELNEKELSDLIFSILKESEKISGEIYQVMITIFEISLACEKIIDKEILNDSMY